MLKRRIALAALPLAMVTACFEEPENACDRYVDYMCECHADDEGFDCAELQAAYADADQTLQESCQLDLEDQRASDEDEGESCELSG